MLKFALMRIHKFRKAIGTVDERVEKKKPARGMNRLVAKLTPFLLIGLLLVPGLDLEAKKGKKKRPSGDLAFPSRSRPNQQRGPRRTRRSWPSWWLDEGVSILEYEIREGNSISFRVGGKVEAYMERIGPAPEGDMFMDAASANVESVTVEYEHALAGPQTKVLGPCKRLTLNAVVSRHWKIYRSELGVRLIAIVLCLYGCRGNRTKRLGMVARYWMAWKMRRCEVGVSGRTANGFIDVMI